MTDTEVNYPLFNMALHETLYAALLDSGYAVYKFALCPDADNPDMYLHVYGIRMCFEFADFIVYRPQDVDKYSWLANTENELRIIAAYHPDELVRSAAWPYYVYVGSV